MFDKLINRYVRHTLTAAAGYLVHKGVVDAELAGATVEVAVSFVSAAALGWGAILFSKVSDKLKLG